MNNDRGKTVIRRVRRNMTDAKDYVKSGTWLTRKTM